MKNDIWTYGTTKLLLLMACKEMVRRLEGSGVTVLTAWPGIAGVANMTFYDQDYPAPPPLKICIGKSLDFRGSMHADLRPLTQLEWLAVHATLVHST